MAQPTRPGQTPNLFNLNPLAYRLNQGGRQFNSVQRIRDNKDVEIEGGSAARLAGAGYEPILAQIRQAAQKTSSNLAQASNSFADFDSKVAEMPKLREEANIQAGRDIVGNIAVRAIPGVGLVSLASKGADLILQDDSAVNDYVRKVFSDEAGDALNSVAEAGQEIGKGITTVGNAFSDIGFGLSEEIPIVGEFAQAIFGGIGSAVNNLFGSGGATPWPVVQGNYYSSRYNAGTNYYNSIKDNISYDGTTNFDQFVRDQYNTLRSTTDSSDVWMRLATANNKLSKGQLGQFVIGEANTYSNDPTKDYAYVALHNNLRNTVLQQQEQKVQAAQQQAQEEAARQEAARTASKNEYLASLGRTPGSASPDAGYDIPTEPISRGVQLANTSLYNDDLHQQMIARSK